MNKKILLIALVLCLIAGGNLLAANLLLNPDFETGTLGQFGSAVITSWTTYGTNGWYHTDSGKVIDLRAVKVWSADTYLYQDFSATVGKVYDVNVYAFASSSDNTGLGGQNGVLVIQWLNSAKTTILRTDTVGYFYGDGVDAYDSWKFISGVVSPPTDAVYGRALLKIVVTTGTIKGSINWDNVSVAENLYMASSPNPANGSTVDTGTSTTLSWTRPSPRHSGDTITCDVWFGTDANMPGTNTKIVSSQAVSSISVGTLASSTDYYWKVDCYDPDGSDPTVETEGMTWAFTTKNQPPSVDAGDKQAIWMASGSAVTEMNSVVSDDGFPKPSALTYSWTVDSGTGTPTFSPSNAVQNPTVTFTTAGDYVLRLTVSDGDEDANDTVKIRVYTEGYTGLVAYWKLDETTGTTAADSSGNGNSGSLVGSPVWQSSGGQVNGAIQLSGTGDYINCGNIANLTEEITVSAWIKCTFDKSWEAIVTKGDSSWRLFRDCTDGDSNNASFTLTDIGAVVSGSTGSGSDNKWHYIVGTLDGVHQCIYVDGILAASSNVSAGSIIALNEWNVCIGADDENEGEREFNGLIDEVRIYEIGLTAAQVLEQFIADGGHDSCGLNYLPGDLNEDCYVNFADFAVIAENWLKCNDVTKSNCE